MTLGWTTCLSADFFNAPAKAFFTAGAGPLILTSWLSRALPAMAIAGDGKGRAEAIGSLRGGGQARGDEGPASTMSDWSFSDAEESKSDEESESGCVLSKFGFQLAWFFISPQVPLRQEGRPTFLDSFERFLPLSVVTCAMGAGASSLSISIATSTARPFPLPS